MMCDELNDPFFLVYKSRSGSTYLANLLMGNPEVALTPESNFIKFLWDWSHGGRRWITDNADLHVILDRVLFAEAKFCTWNLPLAEVRDLLNDRLPLSMADCVRCIVAFYCRTNFPTAKKFGVKNGNWNTYNIPVLRKLFPQSKFLHIIRDGRGSFASGKKAVNSYDRVMDRNAVQSACLWRRIVLSVEPHLQHDYALEIRYEDLIAEPEKVLARVNSFLGVNSTPASGLGPPSLRYNYFDPRRSLHENVGKAPQLERIEAWRNELSSTEIGTFECVAGRALLGRKGYSLAGQTTRRAALLGPLRRWGFWLDTASRRAARKIESKFRKLMC